METNFNIETSFNPKKLLKDIPFTTPGSHAIFQITFVVSAGYLISAKNVSIIESLIEPLFMTVIAAAFYIPLFALQALINGCSDEQLNNEIKKAMYFTSGSSLLCILALSLSSNKDWSLDFLGDLTILGFFASLFISAFMALFISGSIPVSIFFRGRAVKLIRAIKRFYY